MKCNKTLKLNRQKDRAVLTKNRTKGKYLMKKINLYRNFRLSSRKQTNMI